MSRCICDQKQDRLHPDMVWTIRRRESMRSVEMTCWCCTWAVRFVHALGPDGLVTSLQLTKYFSDRIAAESRSGDMLIANIRLFRAAMVGDLLRECDELGLRTTAPTDAQPGPREWDMKGKGEGI